VVAYGEGVIDADDPQLDRCGFVGGAARRPSCAGPCAAIWTNDQLLALDNDLYDVLPGKLRVCATAYVLPAAAGPVVDACAVRRAGGSAAFWLGH
jgi:hypothetical protein